MTSSLKKDQSKIDLLTDGNILLMAQKISEVEYVTLFIDA